MKDLTDPRWIKFKGVLFLIVGLLAAALLASGSELSAAVGEALAFLDQSLDAGFRPGMGNVIPDRFFWALPPDEDGESVEGEEVGAPGDDVDTQGEPKGAPRRVH